jgi:hypothetical protein
MAIGNTRDRHCVDAEIGDEGWEGNSELDLEVISGSERL